MNKLFVGVLGACLFGSSTLAAARDQLRIVGSSTVYPFTSVVAEHFGRIAGNKTPIVESTGTGGGFKLFCGGVGLAFPDVVNASRKIKPAEQQACRDSGVTNIKQLEIGIDGLVLIQSKSGRKFKLTTTQLFLAIAKDVVINQKIVKNPHNKWSDIDKTLPNVVIEVLGPPPTSGTRDSLHELLLADGVKKLTNVGSLTKKQLGELAKFVRTDGKYIEAGENDTLIIAKIKQNPNAVGILGYSYADQNTNVLSLITINNIEPTHENIQQLKYPGARKLFVYFKQQHYNLVRGLERFEQLYSSPRMIGRDGVLENKGLISLSN